MFGQRTLCSLFAPPFQRSRVSLIPARLQGPRKSHVETGDVRNTCFMARVHHWLSNHVTLFDIPLYQTELYTTGLVSGCCLFCQCGGGQNFI